MPKDDLHKAQRGKNIALLVILVALMLLVYAIAIMRMKSAT